MTKLEEKLIELGYEKEKLSYVKRLEGRIEIHIFIYPNELVGGVEQGDHFVIYQSQINRLQKAFNQLQKDLEELKECQD